MKDKRSYKEITVLNVSDPYNKGDLAILENTLRLLKKYYCNSKISVVNVTYSLKEIKEFDGFGFLKSIVANRHFGAFFPRVFRSANRFSDLIDGFKYLLLSGWILFWTVLLGRSAEMFIKGNYRDSFNAIKNADFIILKGGSYLYSYGKIKDLIFLYRMLFPSILSILLNKKVIALGHSVGPLIGSPNRKISLWALKRFARIIAREEITYNFLTKALKLEKEKIILLPDLAFWKDNNEARSESHLIRVLEKEGIKYKDSASLKVGITIRSWHFPLQKDAKGLFENYITSVAESIKYMCSQYNASCFIMPHVQKDLSIGEQVYSMTKSCNVFLLKGHYSPTTMRKIYGEMDLFIGTRIHSNIFAISEGVPAIAIAYEIPKGYGIIGMVGLKKYILNIAKIQVANLIKKIDMLLQNRKKVRADLLKRVNKMSNDIEVGFQEIMDFLLKDH